MEQEGGPYLESATLPDPTIVYIAGYGRSGSTLIDRVLGSYPGVIGCGEIAVILDRNITDFSNHMAQCPCGRVTGDCPVWSQLIKELEPGLGDRSVVARWNQIRLRIEGTWGLWRLVLPGCGRAVREEYRELTRRVFGALAESGSDACTFIIDSSKSGRDTVWRPVGLARLGGYRTLVIHVVRDPRGVLWSEARHERKRSIDVSTGMPSFKDVERSLSPRNVARVLVGWIVANTGASVAGALLGRHRYLRLSYEQIASQPGAAFGLMSRFIGLDTPVPIPNDGADVKVGGHQLHGNRMRHLGKVSIRPDDEWKQKLRIIHRVAAIMLTWPWLLAYRGSSIPFACPPDEKPGVRLPGGSPKCK